MIKQKNSILGSVSEGGHAGANWVRRSITINTGFGEKRFRDGNIEELLIHEGAHVSLDNYHKDVSRILMDAIVLILFLTLQIT